MKNRTTPVKPVNIVYGVDDRPPLSITTVLAFQHVLLMSVNLIFPVLVVQAIGGTQEEMQGMVSLSMIAGGVGTVLMTWKKGPFGSGYAVMEGGSEPYLPAVILAVKSGGYPLMFGMTIVAGLFQALLSQTLHRLRFLFPTEVTGVVVFMVGASIIPVSVELFFGAEHVTPGKQAYNIIVAALTYGVMVGATIWGKGSLRQYGMLIGIIIGYLLSFLCGFFTGADYQQVNEAPLLAVPYMGYIGWSFDAALLFPFLVAGLCASLKAVGDLTNSQKINDAHWKRPDMGSISGGVLANAVKTVFSGITGGMAHTTSSANIGLSLATGATSRIIAYVAGGIWVVLAFFPKLSAVFSIMPEPVMGAALIFCITFMMVSGFQIMMSRMLDTRKTIVIGTALIVGLSVDILPELYSNLHPLLRLLFDSSVTAATVSVVLLNLIMRIGIRQRETIELVPGEDNYENIVTFMEKQGAAWGARREVVYRAVSAMNEFMESATALQLTDGKITMDVSFDEFNLDVNIRYQGILMEFPSERPTEDDLISDENAFIKLSGFMMRQLADRIKWDSKEGSCNIQFHFDH